MKLLQETSLGLQVMDFTDWLESSVVPAAAHGTYINLATILFQNDWQFHSTGEFKYDLHKIKLPAGDWLKKHLKSVRIVYSARNNPSPSPPDFAMEYYPVKEHQTAEDVEFACSEVKEMATT